MAGFNRVTLIGNLTRDPQSRTLPSQTKVADFGLAVSRRFRTQVGEEREETCFLDCAAFGKQAEVICKYLQKGKPVFLEGRLKYDTWEDKQGFGRRGKISVVVESFQFLASRELNSVSGQVSDGPSDPREADSIVRRGGDRFEQAPMFQEADIPF